MYGEKNLKIVHHNFEYLIPMYQIVTAGENTFKLFQGLVSDLVSIPLITYLGRIEEVIAISLSDIT